MNSKLKILTFLLALVAMTSTARAQCFRTISASQIDVCAGATVTYSVSIPTASSTYYWYLGGPAAGTIIGQGNSSIQVQWDSFIGFASETSTVECIVTDPVNCPMGVNVTYYTETIYPIYPTSPSTGPSTGALGTTSIYTNTKSYGAAYAGYHTVTGGVILSETSDFGWPTETITTIVQWTALGTGEVCWHEGYVSPYCEGVNCRNVMVTAGTPPVVSITGSGSTCSNSLETYSVPAASGNTYVWNVTGGSIQSGSGTEQVEVLWSSPGTISAQVTNAFGSASDQMQVAVSPSPVVTASAVSPTVYMGYSAAACTDLNAGASGGSGNYTFAWSNNASGATINVCPTVATTYTVSVTDQAGCSDDAAVQVNVQNVACGSGKIIVCHRNSNGSYVTKCIKAGTVDSHLAHGDQIGSCSNKSADDNSLQPESALNFVAEVLPNPFTGSTHIRLEAASDEVIRVQVIDMQGRTIASLYDGPAMQGEAIDLAFTAPSSGIYFCRIEGSESGSKVLKLLSR